MKKELSYKIVALTFGVLVICFAVAFYAMGWTEPTADPPSGGVDAPINTGSVGQSKIGGLILNTGGATNGLIIDSGNVGIGNSSPTEALDVTGNIVASGTVCDSVGCIGDREVRVWQNMGLANTADNINHSTSCDPGYLMSGVRVYIQAALDGFMIARCTKSSFSFSGSTIKGPTGNMDYQFHNLNCDDNQVIRSITVYSTVYFDYNLRLDCGNLVGASLDNSNVIWALNLYGGVNNDMYTSALNAIYDNKMLFAECPYGYVATGIRAYAYNYLENFDILCKKVINN